MTAGKTLRIQSETETGFSRQWILKDARARRTTTKHQ